MAQAVEVFSELALESLRRLFGVPMRREFPYNEVATKDAIRHFAFGYGDTNPLWSDEEYATKTRYGSIVAPPTFLCSCQSTLVGASSMGLAGAHALYQGDDWEWSRPISAGDRITDEETVAELREVRGQFASRMYEQVGQITFRNQNGEIIGIKRELCWRFERQAREKRDRYAAITRQHYTPEQIRAIQEDYDKEEVRGPKPRYWEDVQVGDPMPHVVKGPLTVSDVIAWKMGWGYRPFLRAHGIRLAFERRHSTSAITNAYGIPDVPERVHWEDEMAQRIGMPAAFDYGPQRVTWMAQVVTNWMGDDGTLRQLKVRVRRPNHIGDTTWCRGKVVNKHSEPGKHLVECELWAEDQRGRRTTTGWALVELPSRA